MCYKHPLITSYCCLTDHPQTFKLKIIICFFPPKFSISQACLLMLTGLIFEYAMSCCVVRGTWTRMALTAITRLYSTRSLIYQQTNADILSWHWQGSKEGSKNIKPVFKPLLTSNLLLSTCQRMS